jgi:putative membrane protein
MYTWNWEPGLLVGLAGQIVAYLLCTLGPLRRFFPGSGPPSALEVQLFVLGWLSLFTALVSPIDTLSNYSLTMHMVQHILLTLIAPPLMLLGTPSWLFQPIARVPFALTVGRFVTNPVFVFFLFNAVFLGWHVPAYYNAALTFLPLHILEHIMFFGAATLSWWPIFSPMAELPRAHPLAQTAFLFFQALPATILGALIAFASEPLYPHYTTVPNPFGLSVLDDQQLAGLIMWVPASLVYFAVLTIVFIRWLNRDEHDLEPYQQVTP